MKKFILTPFLMLAATTLFAGGAGLVQKTSLPKATSVTQKPTAPDNLVVLKTNAGDITVELAPQAAPQTVANFQRYVQEGFYTQTICHRVIPSFMIQCGGFEKRLHEKPTHKPIKNEARNGLKNLRGTIAMARTSEPDSATAQFFINLADNAFLDSSAGQPGYTVFGKVEGMDVVDKIAAEPTHTVGMYADVPVNDVVILSAAGSPEKKPLATKTAPISKKNTPTKP